MNNNPLISFLQYNKKKYDNQPITNTCMTYPKGSYTIQGNKQIQLIKLLTQHNKKIGITEYHTTDAYEPLILDIDLLVTENIDINQFCSSIVSIYNDCIKELIKCDNYALKAYICTKKDPFVKKDENIMKLGIHIYYPNIAIQSFVAIKIIDIFINRVNPYLDELPLVTKDNIFDRSIYTGIGLLMFGCVKDTSSAPYQVHSILDAKCLSLSLVNDTICNSTFGCMATFSINRHMFDTNLPKYDLINSISMNVFTNQLTHYNNNNVLDNNIEIQIARQLIKILNNNRANNEPDWFRVGLSLYNINKCELLQDFLTFSMRCPKKYNRDACIRKWRGFSRSQIKHSGCLYKFAKEDNFDKFLIIIQSHKSQDIEII